MRTMTNIFKIGAFMLFISLMTSCLKNEDPYADYTLEREAALIKEWVAAMTARGNEIKTTSGGLQYILDKTKTGTGTTVTEGKTVVVKYTGMFLDGQVFDASSLRDDGTMTYKHKVDRMVPGWEEGIEVLNKGASAVFLLPSSKAYGTSGAGPIPPNTPLLFIIEVVDIK